MPILAQGVANSIDLPLLVFYGVANGWLVDVAELSFQIWSVGDAPAQIYPADSNERATVDLEADRIAKGRYAPPWTPSATGRFEVRWFYRIEDGDAERQARTAFEVVSSLLVSGPLYAGPAELAEEGSSGYSEARRLVALSMASHLLERFTRTFFEPRYLELLLDGTGSKVLHLQHPISAIESITLRDVGEVDPDDVLVFGRHLQGVTEDARNPKILHKSRNWPYGNARIEVRGVFGSLVPGAPWGDPHPLAAHAVKLLAMRELAPMADADARFEVRSRGRIRSESTRDQSYSLGPDVGEGRGGGPPNFTGDQEIDQIIALLRAPMRIAGS